jgi:hypothetical protein
LAGAARRTGAVAGRRRSADPQSDGLACPGPWWDEADDIPAVTAGEAHGELAGLEARLLEADGRRVWAQQHARADLTDRGLPLTRLNVARRACELLDAAELTAC